MPLSIGPLSGHRTYKETVGGNIKNDNGEYMFLNADDFAKKILDKMEENKF